MERLVVRFELSDGSEVSVYAVARRAPCGWQCGVRINENAPHWFELYAASDRAIERVLDAVVIDVEGDDLVIRLKGEQKNDTSRD